MKKSKAYIAVFVATTLLMVSGCDTSSNLPFPREFMKLYGGDGDQFGVDMVELGNGNLLLLGNTQFDSKQRCFIVEVDAFGNMLRETVLGGPADIAMDIEATPDGNFVILSRVATTPNDTDFKLTRITAQGVVLDSIEFGFDNAMDYPKTVTPLADGGFLVTGHTLYGEQNPTSPDPNAISQQMQVKVNADNSVDPFFRQVYGDQDDHDVAIKAFVAGTMFYVFGHSSQAHDGRAAGTVNLQYYPVTVTGDPGNAPGFLGDFDTEALAAAACRVPEAIGGGYAMIATVTAAGTSSLHIAVVNGSLVFGPADEKLDARVSNDAGRNLKAVSIAPSVRGVTGYLLLADETRALGTRNIFLTKVDRSAAVQWSVSLGSEREDDRGAAVLEIEDGSILVLGTIELGDNQSKMALFKLNDRGELRE